MIRLAPVPLLLIGCAGLEPPSASGETSAAPVAWNEGVATQVLEPTRALLHGSFPSVGAFERQVSDGGLRFSDRELDLDLHSTDPNWAMLGGWIDASVLEMGGWTTLDATNHFVLGCAGPAQGVMDFDESAESVRVWLDEIKTPDGPALELEVDAIFGGGWEASTVLVVPDPRFGGSEGE